MGKAPPPIRNRIRELRFHAGEMTQADLAARIGMTRQTIVAMEQGKYSIVQGGRSTFFCPLCQKG